MMTGDFDLSIGGISGSALDAASFLDTYCSDNRSGFSLNWGITTAEADIEVLYYNDLGEARAEMWSFDAIVSALNGEIFVANGEEAVVPAPKLTEATSTTATFTIDEFDNVAYDNITYSVLIYNDPTGAYDPLPGYQDIPCTTETMVIEGLTPYYYWYTIEDELLYQSGDYIIQLNFDYKEFEGKTGTTQTSWFPMETLLPESVTNGWSAAPVTETSAVLDLTPEAAYTGTVVSLTLTGYDWVEVTTATIDQTDLSAVSISGLATDTAYILWVEYDDGLWDAVRFSTDPALAAVVTATETGATMVVTMGELDGTTRLITAASVVTIDDEDVETAVAGATVDFADLAAVAVAGLTAETTYYVVFTVDDGSEVYVEVTTEAAPAA